MPTRRSILQGGLGLSVLPLLRGRSAKADTPKAALSIENAWVDTSLEAGRAFSDRATALGANVIDTKQAASPALLAQLDLEWRTTPEALVGVTTHGPMFTLEMLGRRHGMHLAYSAKMMRWEDGTCGVDVNSASNMCMATPAPGVSDASWAIEMANFALTTPLGEFSKRGTKANHQIGDRMAGSYDDPLYVWVIAPAKGAASYIAPAMTS